MRTYIGSTSSVNQLYEEMKPKRKEYKRITPAKPKMKWTTSLHNQFLFAINQIGLEKAVPKKILELMNVPGLTRENVASHLQKYRIALRRVVDKSNEASRNSCERILLRSRFARNHSFSIFNSYQQQQNGPFHKAFNNGKLLSYSHQEGSNGNSITPFKDRKSHLSLNTISALQQPNHLLEAKSSSFGQKISNSFRLGDVSNGILNVGSSTALTANGANGLMASTNGIMQAHQNQAQGSSGLMTNIGTNELMTCTTEMQENPNEAQPRQEVFTKSSNSYDFTVNGLGSQNYISGINNLGSFKTNRSNLNNMIYPIKNKYAETQMTKYGGNFVGYGDQIGNYVGEASNGFGGGYFSNVVQHESALVHPPPQTLQEIEQKDGTDSGNILFGSMENSSTFNSNSLQQFTDGPNQRGGDVLEHGFSISSYNVEAPQQLLQPSHQPKGGEEVISTQKFSENMYEEDDILSWFDPQMYQQAGEEFVNSELYGMNQAGGTEMIDPLFGVGAYDLVG